MCDLSQRQVVRIVYPGQRYIDHLSIIPWILILQGHHDMDLCKIRKWNYNYIHGLWWDAITHPRSNFNGVLSKPLLKLGMDE